MCPPEKDGDGWKSRHRPQIEKATKWLIAQSPPQRNGLIYSGHDSETARYMEGHGFATLFLAGTLRRNRENAIDYIYSEEEEARWRKLGDAVRYIEKAQSSAGGWYHTSKVEGHDLDALMPTAIQVQALQAAKHSDVRVAPGVLNGGYASLAQAVRAGSKNATPASETVAALIALWNDHMDSGGLAVLGPEYIKSIRACDGKIPVGPACKSGRDELTHYYFAQLTFARGSDTWTTYRDAMYEHLRSTQSQDGSWPGGDDVGRVYATALWCIVMQMETKAHPSRPRGVVLTR
jgi:hypothetical protein